MIVQLGMVSTWLTIGMLVWMVGDEIAWGER